MARRKRSRSATTTSTSDEPSDDTPVPPGDGASAAESQTAPEASTTPPTDDSSADGGTPTKPTTEPAKPTPEDTPSAHSESDGEATSTSTDRDATVAASSTTAEPNGSTADASPAAEASSPGDRDTGPQPVARPPGSSRQRAIRAAMATLPVPEPGPSFWADLDAAIAEHGRSTITARPAIRPISEPPPLSQPTLSDHLTTLESPESRSRGGRPEGGLTGGNGGSGSRRSLIVVAVAVIAGLLVIGSLLGDDESPGPSTDTSSSTTLTDEVTSTVPGSTTTTLPQVSGLDQATPLTPAGVGPLEIGMRRRDLHDRGVETSHDEAAFQSSGGSCFSGAVPAAPDLVLWFRSEDPGEGVDDPLDAELAAISVNSNEGSQRRTDAGLGLGAPDPQVVGSYGDVDASPDPAGGQVYVVDATDGSDNGIAYITDGAQVTKINVGHQDVIPQPETCTT